MPHPKYIASAKIYLDCRKMIDLILDCVPQFPRDYKFTIGAEMQKLSVSIMQEVAAAYLNRNPMEKAQHLMAVQAQFETLKMLIRIAGERKWIKGIHKHAALIELTEVIGKQIAAWKNKVFM